MLRVLFLYGDAEFRQGGKSAFAEWAKYANLHFEWVGSGESDIRVSFKNSGYYSYRGTDSLAVAATQATLNLGPPTQVVPRNIFLRETGHALGLTNELENPNAKIPWNKTQTYEYFASMGLTKEMTDLQIFNLSPQATPRVYRQFDPRSVMTFEPPPDLVGGMHLGGGGELSGRDKQLIASTYPKS